jgi:hypothetical protein
MSSIKYIIYIYIDIYVLVCYKFDNIIGDRKILIEFFPKRF